MPPLPPVGGAASNQTDLELKARDGNSFAAFAARAQKPTGAGVVILPDVRGLHRFYKELAVRFAEAGIDAVAFDYYGRTAGVGSRDESFDYAPHRQQTRPETIAADVAACIDYLHSPEGGAVQTVFTLGFCFGGGNSWLQAAVQPGLAGAIGFYGRPETIREQVEQLSAPLLLLVAGADQGIPLAEATALDRSLTETGKPHEMHVFEGAPHSFFDRRQDDYRAASEQAWRFVLDFIERHSLVEVRTHN